MSNPQNCLAEIILNPIIYFLFSAKKHNNIMFITKKEMHISGGSELIYVCNVDIENEEKIYIPKCLYIWSQKTFITLYIP